MASRPQLFSALDETPRQLNASMCEVQILTARNPHATTLAYVKIYEQAATPDGSAVPLMSFAVPPAETIQRAVYCTFGPVIWFVGSTDAGAGLTAPATDLHVNVTYDAAKR